MRVDAPYEGGCTARVVGLTNSKKKHTHRRRSVSTLDVDAAALLFYRYADQALPVAFFAPAWRLVGQVVDDLKKGYDGFLLHPGDLGYAEG